MTEKVSEKKKEDWKCQGNAGERELGKVCAQDGDQPASPGSRLSFPTTSPISNLYFLTKDPSGKRIRAKFVPVTAEMTITNAHYRVAERTESARSSDCEVLTLETPYVTFHHRMNSKQDCGSRQFVRH